MQLNLYNQLYNNLKINNYNKNEVEIYFCWHDPDQQPYTAGNNGVCVRRREGISRQVHCQEESGPDV